MQDIRPAEPRKSRARPMNTSNPSINEETVSQEETIEREHIPSIVIEDGTKRKVND